VCVRAYLRARVCVCGLKSILGIILICFRAICTLLCMVTLFNPSNPPPTQTAQPALVAKASSLSIIHDHSQTRHTLGRSPLDEWSARRRDLHQTKHNTRPKETNIHVPGMIRTRNRSKRADADPGLTPRGHWFIIYFPQQNVNICCYLYIYILYIKTLKCKCHCFMDSPLLNIERTRYISAHVFLVLPQCSTTCRPWWPQKDIQSFLFPPILWLFLLTSPVACVLWQWNLDCPST